MKQISVPKKLYKYRAFNPNTLRLLGEAEMYYADPANFNDPLDCKPYVNVDTDLKTLERLCYRMLVLNRGKEKAVATMREHQYMATEQETPEEETAAYTGSLRNQVERLIYADMRKQGVASLARRWNCPLMWSHYADEHRGLCIEYDTKDHHCAALLPVRYDTPGAIAVSDLYRWKVERSEEAGKLIHRALFYAKAPDWKYEREWRDVGKLGASESTLRAITAVYFGLRCDYAILASIVMLFGKGTKVRFFSLYRANKGFALKRSEVDTAEILALYPRKPIMWDFQSLDEPELQASDAS